MKRGVVISDLHIFARRSRADQLMQQVYVGLEDADLLVLNGDTFDLRWTTLPSIRETIIESIRWLEDLARRFPDCKFHYVLGNHDCHRDLVAAMDALANGHRSFSWHEYYFHLGNILFLHGDCAHRSMSGKDFALYREPWRRLKKRSQTLAVIYELMDQTGLTMAAHRLYFPRQKVVDRILSYLNDTEPMLVGKIDQIYFGHTHLPFADYQFKGLHFHNTGSAVKRMELNMLQFEICDA